VEGIVNDRSGRVTIRQVAADAGLSIATVSRTLTGARAVTPDIAERVRESAERLGYRADSIGRSLRTQRTKTLGLVIPDITNPFFPALVQAIEHAARQSGLAVLIADADNDPDVERAALRTLIDRRVDAVLISPTHLTASLDGLAEAAGIVPTIQIDQVINAVLPYVRVNQAQPMEAIVNHLRSSGRAHIGFIGQPATVATVVERERAFEQLMTASYPAEPLRVRSAGMSAESGRTATREIMAAWPETDAIICANDVIAVGVLQELGSHPGRRPVAVSGFDDTLLAQAMQLTSVRQPVDDIAEAAISAVAATGEAATHTQVELAAEVIFRLSTA
jgi:LacI family transcriptional regulator